MKNTLTFKIIKLTLILLFITLACVKIFINQPDVLFPDENNDKQQIQFISKSITIQDKTRENKITLRLSCNDIQVLNEFADSKWQLVTMYQQDSGIDAIITDDYQFIAHNLSTKTKMRIEMIEKIIKPDVVGYYIANNSSRVKLKKRPIKTIIESEFISEYETFGGFLQIYQTNSSIGKSIWMNAHALDDPLLEPKTGMIDPAIQNPFLSIGFNDEKGLAHAWRVLVRHDISTFPIIYWIGEPRLP